MSAPPDFSLRRIALPAFGPSITWSIGAGAIAPIVALSARDLGASTPLAAVFAGLGAAGEFVAAVPAGTLVARIGEKRGLILAGLLDALASALSWWAPNLAVLAVGLLLMGPAGAVFLLSRQSYLTAAAPVHLRARAMSTLGGVTRIGFLVGPFLGAPLVSAFGTKAAYAVAAVAGLLAVAVAGLSMDLRVHGDLAATGRERVRTWDLVRENRVVLGTVGVGVLLIGLARSGRVVAVPLWAESIGLRPEQVSVVFGIATAVEVLVFYPAGSVMDRWGRVFVAVPTVVLLGVGLVLLPLTNTFVGVVALALLTGLGNGLGSGIVMTLGADAAPSGAGRAQFLSVWRLVSLVGHNGAPLAIAGVTALAGLATASVGLGLLCLAGGAWLWRWLPAYEPRGPGSGDA